MTPTITFALFLVATGGLALYGLRLRSELAVARRTRAVLQQSENQRLQAHTLEAVGRLAGGIAHDFNNLLTVMAGYSQLALLSTEQETSHRHIKEVITATGQAAGLTRQLLAISQRQASQPRVLALNPLVAGTDPLLRRLLGETIEVVTALARSLGNVQADPGQMEQVLLNLVLNARDALPGGGTLTIETANVDLGEINPVGAMPGPYVMLAVSDDGVGMDDATRHQLFEPFFTTKRQDKGAGLGLATVYGIVKQSGGHVAVQSQPGRGARFEVYLPRVEEAVAIETKGVAAALPHGVETLLLVEDEGTLRPLLSQVLQREGYDVLEAEHGIAGLETARNHQGFIHLLITDVTMPEMGGAELARRLQEFRPALKVLYISGYTEAAIGAERLLPEGEAYLQKPFTLLALVTKVREVLDGRSLVAATNARLPPNRPT